MKSLFLIPLIFILNCNVNNDNCSNFNLTENQVALKATIDTISNDVASFSVVEILELSKGNYPIPSRGMKTPYNALVSKDFITTVEINLNKERILIIEWNDAWMLKQIF